VVFDFVSDFGSKIFIQAPFQNGLIVTDHEIVPVTSKLSKGFHGNTLPESAFYYIYTFSEEDKPVQQH
jgi:hypothetical protein